MLILQLLSLLVRWMLEFSKTAVAALAVAAGVGGAVAVVVVPLIDTAMHHSVSFAR